MKKNVLLLAGLMMLSGCGGNHDDYVAPHKLQIDNYSDYKQIGVGVSYTDNTNTKQRIKRRETTSEEGMKYQFEHSKAQLLGFDSQGVSSEIKLHDENGKAFGDTLYLTQFKYTKSFSLLQYTNKQAGFISGAQPLDELCEWLNVEKPTKEYWYLLSMATGNMYYLDTSVEVDTEKYPSVVPYNCIGGNTQLFCDSRRFYEENNELVIETIDNLWKNDAILMSIDRYDHPLYCNNDGHYFYMTSDNVLHKINFLGYGYDGSLYTGNNGDAYSLETKTFQRVNEDGELVDKELIPLKIDEELGYKLSYFNEIWSNAPEFIAEFDGIKYYLSCNGVVVDVDFDETDDTNYTLEGKCQLPMKKEYYSLWHFKGDDLYILNSGRQLQKLSFKTFTLTNLLEGFSIDSAGLDSEGHITFKGTDDNLNEVTGYLNDDDTPNYSVIEGSYSMEVIAPIN